MNISVKDRVPFGYHKSGAGGERGTFGLKLADFSHLQSKLVKIYHKRYHKSKATIEATISYFLDKNFGI